MDVQKAPQALSRRPEPREGLSLRLRKRRGAFVDVGARIARTSVPGRVELPRAAPAHQKIPVQVHSGGVLADIFPLRPAGVVGDLAVDVEHRNPPDRPPGEPGTLPGEKLLQKRGHGERRRLLARMDAGQDHQFGLPSLRAQPDQRDVAALPGLAERRERDGVVSAPPLQQSFPVRPGFALEPGFFHWHPSSAIRHGEQAVEAMSTTALWQSAW